MIDNIDDHTLGMPRDQADMRFRETIDNKRRDLEHVESYSAFNFLFFVVLMTVTACVLYVLFMRWKPSGFNGVEQIASS